MESTTLITIELKKAIDENCKDIQKRIKTLNRGNCVGKEIKENSEIKKALFARLKGLEWKIDTVFEYLEDINSELDSLNHEIIWNTKEKAK